MIYIPEAIIPFGDRFPREIEKLEFIEFPVIANQSADWCGNLLDRSTIFR